MFFWVTDCNLDMDPRGPLPPNSKNLCERIRLPLPIRRLSSWSSTAVFTFPARTTAGAPGSRLWGGCSLSEWCDSSRTERGLQGSVRASYRSRQAILGPLGLADSPAGPCALGPFAASLTLVLVLRRRSPPNP